MKMSDYGSRKDLVILLPFAVLSIGAFIHEYAHVIVALNLGFQIDSIVFTFMGPSKVVVVWNSADVTTGGLFMLGFIGGLMESLFYAAIALKVREMCVMALGLLTYGVAEAFRIALMSHDFLPFELAIWFNLFTMMVTVLLIGRRRHQEWTWGKIEELRGGM